MRSRFRFTLWHTGTTRKRVIASDDCSMTLGSVPRLRVGLLLMAVVLPFGITVVCVAAPPGHDVESSGKVSVTLRPPPRTTFGVLRIADLAELSGGSESLRQRIAALDVEDAPAAGESLDVTSPQIEFRLRLAGIDPRLVTIRGSTVRASARPISGMSKPGKPQSSTLLASHSRAVTAANLKSSDAEQVVLAAAKECLKMQLPWPEEDIEVQLTQPLPRELREALSATATTCSAELRSTGTTLGRIVLRIVSKTPDQRTLDVSIPFDVRHFEEVVVTTKPIAQGHVIALSDLEFGRQDVTQTTGFCTSPDQLIGQKAKRILPAAHVVKAVDVEPVPRAVAPLLVKRRDRVKAIARSGALVVVMVAEAQQDGRAGELIKVKNLDSNAVVHGRVLSATEVEVTD